MSKLDTVVFMIESGVVVESKIRDLDGYIDETTTPRGVGPRLHVRENELWTWGHAGNNPRKLRELDTEDEAVEALEDHHYTDFWNSALSGGAFRTREEAEKFLTDGEV